MRRSSQWIHDSLPSLLTSTLNLDLDATLIEKAKLKSRKKETYSSNTLKDALQYTRRQSLSKSHPSQPPSKVDKGQKWNSCSSLFISSTVGKENMQRVLRR